MLSAAQIVFATDISTCSDINALITTTPGGNFVLTTDIDCAAYTAAGDKFGTINFTGTFDGNNHTISNLYINKAGSYSGLFRTSTGTITNLNITDANVLGTAYVGVLAGQAYGTISNVRITNSAVYGSSSTGYVGGFIGTTNSSSLNLTNSEGTFLYIVGSGPYTGGLVGHMTYSGTLVTDLNVTILGDINGTTYTAGMFGYLGSGALRLKATINRLKGTTYASGLIGSIYSNNDINYSTVDANRIEGTYPVGGLIAYNGRGCCSNYTRVNFARVNIAELRGTGSGIGGIYGNPTADGGATINDSNAIIGRLITSGSNVGGILGVSSGNAYINRSNVTIQIEISRGGTGDSYIGGIAGQAYAIADSSADVNILWVGSYSGNKIGGLAGYINGSVSRSSVRGALVQGGTASSSESIVGGLVGDLSGNVTDTNIRLIDVNGRATVGGLAGYGRGNIVNVKIDINNVRATNGAAAGAVALQYNGDINSVSVDVNTVIGTTNVAGLIGYFNGGCCSNVARVNKSSVRSNQITGVGNVAGLVGTNDVDGGTWIYDSNAIVGRINATSTYVGGLAGGRSSGDTHIYRSFARAYIELTRGGTGDQQLGGLAGKAGTVSQSYADVNIDVTPGMYGHYIGGLVGSAATITQSYATGNYIRVPGSTNYVGGLAGYVSTGGISDSNSFFSDINGASYVGGLAGAVGGGNVVRSHSRTTNVKGTASNIGGLIGAYSGDGFDVNDCYYDGNLVSGAGSVAGLVGNYGYNAGYTNEFYRNYARVNYINSAGAGIGGLIGAPSASATKVYDSNAIIGRIYNSSTSYTGGLVGGGSSGAGIDIYRSFARAYLELGRGGTGDSFVGGLSGYSNGIYDCYADTNINEYITTMYGHKTGGLAGRAVTIQRSNAFGDYIKVTASTNYIGGLVGILEGSGGITDSNSRFNDINGASYVGGLAGQVGSGSIVRSNARVNNIIATGSSVGGLVGTYSGDGFDVNDSYYDGNTVSGASNVSGFVGTVGYSAGYTNEFYRNYSRANYLNGTGSAVGGLVGGPVASATMIYDSNAIIGRIYASGGYVGGLVGGGTSGAGINIYRSNAKANVLAYRGGSGDIYVGGLAGYVNSINQSYFDGNVDLSLSPVYQRRVGGLAGRAADINNSYAKGSYVVVLVASSSYIGGLAGEVTGTVNNSYAIYPDVNGLSSQVGGLVGSVGTSISNSFFVGRVKTTAANDNNIYGEYATNPARVVNCYFVNPTSTNVVQLNGVSKNNSYSDMGTAYFKGLVRNLSREPFTYWTFHNYGGDVWYQWSADYPNLYPDPTRYYLPAGKYISNSIYFGPTPKRFVSVDFNGYLVSAAGVDSNIRIQIRTSDSNDLATGIWSEQFVGPDDTNTSYYTLSGTTDISQSHDYDTWFQWQAFLDSNDSQYTPMLRSVDVNAVSIGHLVLSAPQTGFNWESFDSNENLYPERVSWSYSLNSGANWTASPLKTLSGATAILLKAFLIGTNDNNTPRIDNNVIVAYTRD